MTITNKYRVDGIAISLSFLCALHCLFVPSFVILAPSFLSIAFDNEFIHYLILILAIPVVYLLYLLDIKPIKTYLCLL